MNFTSILISFFSFILAITFLVGVHELGHFLVAKLFKVKVLRFSIGFGKRLLRIKDRRDTEYSISAIPLGGYIKLLDENESPVPFYEAKFAFNRQHPLKKIAITLAGPLSSFLFGILVLWILFLIGTNYLLPNLGPIRPETLASQAGLHEGQSIVAVDHKPVENWKEVTERIINHLGDRNTLSITVKEKSLKLRDYTLSLKNLKTDISIDAFWEQLGLRPRLPPIPAEIASVDSNSPAEKAGLQPGDHIIRINGHKISDFTQLADITKDNPGKPVFLQIQRQGKIKEFRIIPQWHPMESVSRIGIHSFPVQWTEEFTKKKNYSIGIAFIKSLQESANITALNARLLFKIISGQLSWKNLSGPLGIAKGATTSLEDGLSSFLKFLAFISLSLGFVNLLPIPALDGGLFLYGLIELIIRHPLSKKAYEVGQTIGLGLLFIIIIMTIINDIIRLFPVLH